jgi:hypothetical protein
MEFKVVNDYGVGADLDERLKIIREIQISSKNASAIKHIMTNLGSKYKIYQYNCDNRRDYDIFSWNSEDERTYTLTYNRHKGVQNAIIIMNDILNMLKIIDSEIDIKVDVIIKMNNIETDLIRKIKDDIDFENSLKGGLFNENI